MTSPITAAETARTLLDGFGTAELVSAVTGEAVPGLHATDAGGITLVLVPAESVGVLGLGTGSGPSHEDAAVMLRVRAQAPLPDLSLPRALVEVGGWATRVCPDARARAAQVLAARHPVGGTGDCWPG